MISRLETARKVLSSSKGDERLKCSSVRCAAARVGTTQERVRTKAQAPRVSGLGLWLRGRGCHPTGASQQLWKGCGHLGGGLVLKSSINTRFFVSFPCELPQFCFSSRSNARTVTDNQAARQGWVRSVSPAPQPATGPAGPPVGAGKRSTFPTHPPRLWHFLWRLLGYLDASRSVKGMWGPVCSPGADRCRRLRPPLELKAPGRSCP